MKESGHMCVAVIEFPLLCKRTHASTHLLVSAVDNKGRNWKWVKGYRARKAETVVGENHIYKIHIGRNVKEE